MNLTDHNTVVYTSIECTPNKCNALFTSLSWMNCLELKRKNRGALKSCYTKFSLMSALFCCVRSPLDTRQPANLLFAFSLVHGPWNGWMNSNSKTAAVHTHTNLWKEWQKGLFTPKTVFCFKCSALCLRLPYILIPIKIHRQCNGRSSEWGKVGMGGGRAGEIVHDRLHYKLTVLAVVSPHYRHPLLGAFCERWLSWPPVQCHDEPAPKFPLPIGVH